MPGISDIPVEVFEQICSQLRCNDDELNEKEWIACQSTLLSICRVSKAFYKLARPHLYRQIFFVAEKCSDIKFFSLVRALVSQPTLSQQVQSLRISYAQTPDLDDRNWCDYEEYRTPYSIADWNFLTNAVKDRLPWFTFCPRNPIWENTNITVTEIQSRDSDIECSLKYLQAKKLFLYGEDAQTPFRLCGRMFWHWYLPSTLTDLCIRNCELVLADSGGSFFPETWSIKKVSLVDCTMSSDVLSELTNDVFPLEEFEYVVNSKSEDKVALVTAAETIGRLKSYSASLVKLRPRFRLSDGKPIREDEEPYNPSDFCDFKKLKTLVLHLVDFGFHDDPNSTIPDVSTLEFPKSIQDLRLNEVL
ncbi:hypothetical protein COL516b_003330 [Colletotrichum fioriniae]|nr:uncharacterized protein COL516b_003330 [Colletotrichum fioriniae]KAJ0308779.1 hypothetical protein COL516b_003330 [Colletotrichum fioriniae]